MSARISALLRRGAPPITLAAAAAFGASLLSKQAPDEPKDDHVDVVVVGAGLSGLGAAYQLSKTQRTFLLAEMDEDVGGVVRTKRDDSGEYLWDSGPNSFRPTPYILELCAELGLAEQLLLGDPKAPRFVWWDGRLRPLPMSIKGVLFGDWLSAWGKLRFLRGVFGFRPRRPNAEESIEAFITRNFGREAFERLVDPFISGVYAGDPGRLSVDATALVSAADLERDGGSIAGGLLSKWLAKRTEPIAPPPDPRLPPVKGHTVASFVNGLSVLPIRLAEILGDRVRMKWTLQSIQSTEDGVGYRLEFATPGGPRVVQSRAVVLTIPAHALARDDGILAEAPEAVAILKGIEYTKLAALWTAYPKTAVRQAEHGIAPFEGFGQLIPRSAGIRSLGNIYCSSLFPGRCPKDESMVLTYIGGAKDPQLFGGLDSLSEEDLVAQVHADCVRTLLKPNAPEPKVVDIMVWEWAIPQPNVGHEERISKAQEALVTAGMGGVFLAGNYTWSVAFAKCVERGEEVGRSVDDFLKTSICERAS